MDDFWTIENINRYFTFDGRQFCYKRRQSSDFASALSERMYRATGGKPGQRAGRALKCGRRVITISVYGCPYKKSETIIANILTGKHYKSGPDGFLTEVAKPSRQSLAAKGFYKKTKRRSQAVASFATIELSEIPSQSKKNDLIKSTPGHSLKSILEEVWCVDVALKHV